MLPELQLVWRNFPSGVFGEVVGFEEVGVGVSLTWFVKIDESLLEVLEFEDVGLSGFVNNLPFEVVLAEDDMVSSRRTEDLYKDQTPVASSFKAFGFVCHFTPHFTFNTLFFWAKQLKVIIFSISLIYFIFLIYN